MIITSYFILGQHRTSWQEHSAKDFASYESYKRAGILYVFPPFITARMGQKIGRRPQTQLCGDALSNLKVFLTGTYHGRCALLQSYLDEYCFRWHGRKFCVNDFRQTQEYHSYDVHNRANTPCPPLSPSGWNGMRAGTA